MRPRTSPEEVVVLDTTEELAFAELAFQRALEHPEFFDAEQTQAARSRYLTQIKPVFTGFTENNIPRQFTDFDLKHRLPNANLTFAVTEADVPYFIWAAEKLAEQNIIKKWRSRKVRKAAKEISEIISGTGYLFLDQPKTSEEPLAFLP